MLTRPSLYPPPLRSFLHDVQLDDDTRTAVEDMCMTFHTDARHVGAEFLAQLGRHT
jgi:dynein heavy chain